MATSSKPPYRIPTVAEIRAVPENGWNAVSTFSGAGGGSLGLRWAGYTIRWASEFIPAAADTYAANFPTTVLDRRDIREVSGAEILEAAGLDSVDLLEGSPPCASFSSAGSRQSGWGDVRKYSDTKQRVDDLFFEYARLVDELQPKVFVAENVPGLTIGVAKGYLKQITKALRSAGYTVDAKILDAEWLGVPQRRRRLIFVGLRNDLTWKQSPWPEPLPYRYTIREALETVPEATVDETLGEPYPSFGGEWERTRIGGQSAKYFNLIRTDPSDVAPTLVTTAGTRAGAAPMHYAEKRKFTIPELRRLSGFPDDFILTGTADQRGERLTRAVVPPLYYHLGKKIRTALD